MLPPIGQKSPARYGNISKTNGNANMIAELRKYQHGIRRSASAPVNLSDDETASSLSDFRTSGFSVATQGTAATSAAMSRQHSKDGHSGTSISDLLNRSNKARNGGVDTSPSPTGLATLSEDAVLGETKEAEPTSPSPPPPPPPGIVFSADSGPPAPAPPPMPAFLAGISAGVKLRRTPSINKKDLMAPPPPPLLRRSSKRYSKVLHTAPDRRKEVAFTASKKMKTLQWEKVQQGKLDKTLWARAEEEQAQEEVAEKLKMVDVWSEMEDEFKAREAALDAVCKYMRTPGSDA